MKTKIFDQEQIARAVELGLGAISPSQIELLAGDESSDPYVNRINKIIEEG